MILMDRWIVLDIDRTIINGTSWYYTCVCPDLLIQKDKIKLFKEINENLYNNGSFSNKEMFRKLTFELINEKISEECINILRKQGCSNNLISDTFIDNKLLECVGFYTMKNLVSIDEYCIKLISLIYKYYTGKLRILFLTSGYTSYMRGLLSAYMKNFQEEIVWDVIGSDLSFNNGKVQFKRIITQTAKFKIVSEMISRKNEIVLLADDSKDDKRLFEVVINSGGYAFNVKYDKNTNKLNWDDLYNKIYNKNYIKSYLINKSKIRLNKEKNNIMSFYRNHCNEIGILKLDKKDFFDFYNQLDDDKLAKYINEMIYKKNQQVYLRGYTYYFWLPPYINLSLESKYTSWKKLYMLGYNLICYINDKNFKLSNDKNLVTYMACDHLLAALYLALFCIEEQSFNGEYADKINYQYIQEAVSLINFILFSILEEKDYIFELNYLVNILNNIKISDLTIIDKSTKYLLELDNYITIFKTANNIIEELGDKVLEIDSIVCFAYGGIALGYAVQSIINSLKTVPIQLYTSHYSSKRYSNEINLVKKIPIINHRNTFKYTDSTILLIDNNATTFKTLKDAKNYLEGYKNTVYCAVAEVDYNNICSWLLNEDKCEKKL